MAWEVMNLVCRPMGRAPRRSDARAAMGTRFAAPTWILHGRQSHTSEAVAQGDENQTHEGAEEKGVAKLTDEAPTFGQKPQVQVN